jgi:urease accessory protein
MHITTHMAMHTHMNTDSALPRLLQLVSPSLPIGAYTYSQGIEWAVEEGWIKTPAQLSDWLRGLMETSLVYLEIPVLQRLIQAWQRHDELSVKRWSSFLLANRETRELRLEERNRARAMAQIISALEPAAEPHARLLADSQHAAFSYACHRWHIDETQACMALVWGWLENQVLSAVKIIPLGQTDGQRVIFELSPLIEDMVERARQLGDDDLGASSMALAIASSRHETLYTRLFRS